LLVAPDDSVIAATNSFPLTFMEPVTLPTAGVYRVVVDPNLTTMGSVTVTTYDVPADVTGSLTINATASPFTLTVPGQGAHFTFSGTQSQTIRAVLTQPSATCAYLQLFRADQTTFVQSTFDCATTIALPSTVLPATETYHLIVDPVGPVTGSFTISVPSP
jgi:hypothetical protein